MTEIQETPPLQDSPPAPSAPLSPASYRRVQQGMRKDPVIRNRVRRVISFDAELYDYLDQVAVLNRISLQWLVQILCRRALKLRDNTDQMLEVDLSGIERR